MVVSACVLEYKLKNQDRRRHFKEKKGVDAEKRVQRVDPRQKTTLQSGRMREETGLHEKTDLCVFSFMHGPEGRIGMADSSTVGNGVAGRQGQSIQRLHSWFQGLECSADRP